MDIYTRNAKAVIQLVNRVILGKAAVVEEVMMAILADGHILLEDIPGYGPGFFPRDGFGLHKGTVYAGCITL